MSEQPQSTPIPQLPSMLQMATNLANTTREATAHFVKHQIVFAEQAVTDQRLAICEPCEFYIKERKRCSKCGCFTEMKLKIAAAKCPVGKW